MSRRTSIFVPVILSLIDRIAIRTPAKTSARNTILENLESVRGYSTLADLVKEARIDGVLDRPGAYTVFAPDDAAFGRYPRGLISALLDDRPKLAELLQYHVVPGKLAYSDLAKLPAVRTVGRKTLPVGRQGETITVGGARVLDDVIDASNGVIYRVENLIVPPGFLMPQPHKSRRAGRDLGRALAGAITLGGIALLLMRKKDETERARPKTRAPVREARREESIESRESRTIGSMHGAVKPMITRAPSGEEKRRTERTGAKISRPEESPRKARAPAPVRRELRSTDIAKSLSLPLSGNARKGLDMLIENGRVSDKQDFMRFLLDVYRKNDVESMMSEGIEPHEFRIRDMIRESGIARDFFDTDIRKYLVPLFQTGFDAIRNYMTGKPALAAGS